MAWGMLPRDIRTTPTSEDVTATVVSTSSTERMDEADELWDSWLGCARGWIVQHPSSSLKGPGRPAPTPRHSGIVLSHPPVRC